MARTIPELDALRFAAHVARMQAAQARSAALQLQLQRENETAHRDQAAATAILATHGLDPKSVSIVTGLEADGPHPVGTVLDARTNEPMPEPAAEPQHVTRKIARVPAAVEPA